jgi:hypothetical protein
MAMNGSPRVLPLIGGIVAVVGALVSLIAVFLDYYDGGFARRFCCSRGAAPTPTPAPTARPAGP